MFQLKTVLLIASICAVLLILTTFGEEIHTDRMFYKTNNVPCTPNTTVTMLGPYPSVNCTASPYVWCKRYLGIWHTAGFFCTSFV
ncbi:hypothetical protein DAPPUDRAFT_317228 [Daphnia pulex]|uniref:Fibronectin type-II domain-containing protein n=1 Tax=Daphnia pulex TaxID=6669 RepID=E9GFA4_DAPPU|nr:hypothetical protein DAPPUDRAFT_317228 [Daphnia pulex]|eukprot:EFX81605.1 hypothetical protein DAPPUDRAFT_317228 [Daphnia pulex]